MRSITNVYTITATDDDGICLSQTPGGAGALTINGALLAGIPTAQHVTIACAGNETARTFTITGLGLNGQTRTEVVTGVNAATATSLRNFSIVTSVVVDAATAGAIKVGFVQTAELVWMPLNHYAQGINYGWMVTVTTATYSIEGTHSDIQDSTVTALPFTISPAATATAAGYSTVPCRAVRVNLTAWTSGTVTVQLTQADGAK